MASSDPTPPAKGRILVVKISSLGDIVHAFPAVSLLAECRPGWAIDWLCGDAFIPLPHLHPDVSDVIPFARRKLGSLRGFPGAIRDLTGRLRRHRYDLVVDFQGLLRSAACAKLARGGEVIGFARPREHLATLAYSRRFTPPADAVHAVDRNLHLAADAVGFTGNLTPHWEWIDDPAAATAAAALLAASRVPPEAPCLAIVPGARWPTKQWPTEFFACVMATVAAAVPELRFLILGAPAEAADGERLAATVPDSRAINLAGHTDLPTLVAVIRRCRAMLCNDTGPMHLAAALHVPTFALFGATDPARTGPYGPGNQVFQAETDCNPCFRRYCQHRQNRCHSALDPVAIATHLINRIIPGQEEAIP
jgi:lipopolysaccharide heptosyltransferase I